MASRTLAGPRPHLPPSARCRPQPAHPSSAAPRSAAFLSQPQRVCLQNGEITPAAQDAKQGSHLCRLPLDPQGLPSTQQLEKALRPRGGVQGRLEGRHTTHCQVLDQGQELPPWLGTFHTLSPGQRTPAAQRQGGCSSRGVKGSIKWGLEMGWNARCSRTHSPLQFATSLHLH